MSANRRPLEAFPSALRSGSELQLCFEKSSEQRNRKTRKKNKKNKTRGWDGERERETGKFALLAQGR